MIVVLCCRLRCRLSFVRLLSNRAAAVHLALTATTTGDHQNTAEALLGLFQEGTANDELIVGLDSLSIGNTNDDRHGFILCGTQSTKNTPTWYKTYSIVGVVSIPTYKKCYAGAIFEFSENTGTPLKY